MTISDAANYSNIPEGRLRAAIKAGQLGAVQFGRVQKVRRAELIRYVESLQIPIPVDTPPPAPVVPKESAHDERLDEIRAALKACLPDIREAKRLAKLSLRTEKWEQEVSKSFPTMDAKIISMLPDFKPSVIAFEYVGQQMLGVSGRHLQRILASRPKNE